jgi:hypothetical protein
MSVKLSCPLPPPPHTSSESCAFDNKKYYVSFIDDFSKFTWLYLFRHKSEVFKFFKEFQCLVECMFNRKLIAMQMD